MAGKQKQLSLLTGFDCSVQPVSRVSQEDVRTGPYLRSAAASSLQQCRQQSCQPRLQIWTNLPNQDLDRGYSGFLSLPLVTLQCWHQCRDHLKNMQCMGSCSITTCSASVLAASKDAVCKHLVHQKIGQGYNSYSGGSSSEAFPDAQQTRRCLRLICLVRCSIYAHASLHDVK